MREILFRGKRTDNGKWIEGFYSAEEYNLNIRKIEYIPRIQIIGECVSLGVLPETVGQFTGLTDKNGRKIFEGDIVVFADFFDDKIHRGVVYWCDLAFWFDCTETEGDEGMYSLAYISVNVLEVIGNIYDDKEILDVK